MATEQGYSNQKKKGKAQFKTIHSVNSNAYAESVIPKYLYDVNGSVLPVDDLQELAGNNGQIEFLKLTVPGHNASEGDMFRFANILDPSLVNFELEIISVIDVDNFTVLPIIPTDMVIGSEGYVLKWVTALADSDGNPQIAIAPAPVKFLLDGVTTDVSKDSVTPANSVLLPTENLIAQASLSSIDGKFTTLNAKDFATSAKQDTGNTSLSGINTNTINIPNVIATEGGAQPTHGMVVMGHTGAGVARHILVENTGRQVTHVTSSVLPTGASTSALQTTLNNKTAAGLVTVAHDEIVTTYVGATTKINTVVYKLATVTVATLTMSYDGSDRLIGVVRT